MVSTDPDERAITLQPVSETKRKVSIQTDPVESRLSYDNLGYDSHPFRKMSQTSNSDRSELGSVQKKSRLVQSSQLLPQTDVDSLKSYNMERLNGDFSTPSYINQHLSKPNPTTNLEESWIYALCLRCRVEDNTTSWEPRFWQKLFPYPLCPSYRQFANFSAIVLIDE